MTDPKRWSAEGGELHRSLLASARADAGSERALARAMSVFGVLANAGNAAAGTATAAGTGAHAGATASTAGGTAGTSGVVLGATSNATKGLVVTIAKWLSIGALTGVTSSVLVQAVSAPPSTTSAGTQGNAVAIASGLVLPSSDEPPPTTASSSRPSASAGGKTRGLASSHPGGTSRRDPAGALKQADRSERAREPHDEGVNSEPPAVASFGVRETSGTLGEQVRLLNQVREALTHRDSAGALRTLAEYTRRFPNGSLVLEANVLHVEALIRQGDVQGARRVGRPLLARHPAGPHADRVRFLLDESDTTPAPSP